MPHIIKTLLLLALALPMMGCVVEDRAGPGWCANHPYRCH
jgi:hypothetical protein